MPYKRTLLVVEDERALNTYYTAFCQVALRELSAEGLLVEGAVEQAFDYSQARNIIARYADKDQSIDFISLDIALHAKDVGLTEERRREQEPGGMALLRELQAADKQPLSVIVSGETLQSYVVDAWREFGVLTFYQKASFDAEKYRNAIKSVLWYLNTAQLVLGLETSLDSSSMGDITAAEESWKRTCEVANGAGIKEQNFPHALGYRIQSLRDRLVNSISGLPTGHWTEEKLRNEVVGRQDWTLIYVTIKGFGEFVATFASQEQPILYFVADLIKKACSDLVDYGVFAGHLGYREYAREPGFVLVMSKEDSSRAIRTAQWIVSQFDKQAELFAPAAQLDDEAGQRKVSLGIRSTVLTSREYTFEDLQILLDTLVSA